MTHKDRLKSKVRPGSARPYLLLTCPSTIAHPHRLSHKNLSEHPRLRSWSLVLLWFLSTLLPASTTAQPALRSAVRNYQGRPTVFINDQPQAPVFYALTDVPGGRWSWEELPQHNLKAFCADGIRLYQVDLFLEHVWQKNGAMDLSLARRQVQGILDACPGAAVFIRFHLTPPHWWVNEHPDQQVVYDGTAPVQELESGLLRIMEADPRNATRISMASKQWQAIALRHLAQFCKAFSKTRQGKAVAGIQVADGIYGEWHYWGFMKWEADFSAPMTAYFRDWLRQKYQTPERLRRAWNAPQATFDSVAVPNLAARKALSAGNFRHPYLDGQVIDYYMCQHELVADNIVQYCKTIKKNWRRPVITGAFYGYFFNCFNRQAAGGHLALSRVLNSPWIDYLAGPQAYGPNASKSGEPYRSRSLLLSMRLHGKLWLDEMDQQPRRSFPYLGGSWDNRKTFENVLKENVALLQRNLLFAHSKGIGLWLYDFGLGGVDLNPDNVRSTQHGTAGYWDHPQYHKAIKAFKRLEDTTLHQPYQSEADVLVVYDTEVNYHTRSTSANPDSASLQLIDYSSLALYQSGVIFDAVHLDDLGIVDLRPYRVVIMANTFLLDSAERQVIRAKVCRDNRHIVWLYAPGYSNGQTLSMDFTAAVTGFSLRQMPDTVPPRVHLAPVIGDSLTERLWGGGSPVFEVADAATQALGFLADGAPALARKAMPGYTSWFSSVPLVRPEVWRYILREGGAHIFTESGDIVYGGSGMLMVHSAAGGKRELQLRNGQTVTLDFPPGPGTVLIELQNGVCHSGD